LKEEDKGMKRTLAAVLLLSLSFAGSAIAAVETDSDTQRVVGDLHALAAALCLYRDEAPGAPCPPVERLERYLQKPLPDGWPEDYRTAAAEGVWRVGRRVPEFSRARGYIRVNAASLGLYEEGGRTPWLGGAFAWMEVPSAPRVASGAGDDARYLFFGAPDTDLWWWSGLLYTPEARSAALRKFGGGAEPLAIPPAPGKRTETMTGSPVFLPPEFSVRGSGGDEDFPQAEIGGVTINPIPRPRD
jgi:hypothetical protein